MSKYTTEVRFICETLAGYTDHAGLNNVDDVIDKALPKIFNFDYPIFNESYRNVLNRKIIDHYYFREIGFETISLWQYKLRVKLNEIMPFYNQLYEELGKLKDVNLFDNVDYHTHHAGNSTNDTDETSKNTSNDVRDNVSSSSVNSKGTVDNNTLTNQEVTEGDVKQTTQYGSKTENNGTTKSGEKSTSKFSDTPQGGITGIENDNYLTNVTINEKPYGDLNKTTNQDTTTNSGSDVTTTKDTQKHKTTGTNNTNTTDSSSADSFMKETSNKEDINNVLRNIKTTDDFLDWVHGKNGGGSYLEMLPLLKQNLYNVDMLVIEELEELFMQLW